MNVYGDADDFRDSVI